MKSEFEEAEAGTPKSLTAIASERNRWWLFCLTILGLKLFLFMLDPLPKMFLGDSECYVSTALVGWIPDDRSYFYGFVLRWVALSVASFSPLLILQMILSAVIAIVVALICLSILEMPAPLAYTVGFACAIDPLQVVWERYVMTETISLFFYVLVLYWSLLYLRDRRLSHLALVHVLGVLVIGFRMSYLLVTQLNAVFLPLVAFFPAIIESFKRPPSWAERAKVARLAGAHLLVSVVVMLTLHAGYRGLTGLLSGGQPTYLLAMGSHILPAWAPIIEPQDSPDPRLAELIRHGDEYEIKNLKLRGNQHFEVGYLMDRWSKIETNTAQANQIAKATALNALRRNPFQVLGLAWRTFIAYWNPKELEDYARIDLGHVDLLPQGAAVLAEHFHFAADLQIKGAPLTLLQRYFVAALPYCYFILLSPILGLVATYLCRDKRYPLLLLLHIGIILGMTMTFTSAPSLRYLQPISVLTLICVGVCAGAIPIRLRGGARR
jgi:hypothetical protein